VGLASATLVPKSLQFQSVNPRSKAERAAWFPI
jgi:hypothetical protein